METWDEFERQVRSEFPATGSHVIRLIVEECVRVYPDLTEEELLAARKAAREAAPKQFNAVLYRSTIPQVIQSWLFLSQPNTK